ncbi:MAG TPA: sigma-70 family RNA polymerase sigma factor, partial [Actinomycetes bacterium]
MRKFQAAMTTPACTSADVVAAAGGDEEAFARLFRECQPLVQRYLRTLAREAHEDLAADTWLQVVRGISTFRGDVPAFRSWLFTIAHHRYVDHVRCTLRRPPVLDETLVPDLPADRQVEDQVEEVVSTEAALDLIGRLPPDQAEVLVLRVVADLDVAATAAVVGKSRGAVRVLTHRGLKRLASILDSADRQPP